MSPLLTIPELAALFQVGESTVEKKVAAGTWPCTKIAGLVRFTSEHVAAIVAAGEKPAVNDGRLSVVQIRSRRRRSA
jgi:excisionase family DNA binding protein